MRAEDGEGLLTLARSLEADLVVVGPEAPLVAGVANELRHVGVPVFGPSSGAAAIEGSKTFAKDVMRAAGVPTAESLSIARPPCVIKADGLAAGKGVFICHDQAELDDALQAAAAFGDAIVIEELLEGEEISRLRSLRRDARSGPPGRAGLQARRGRRHRAQHGRNGFLLTGGRLRSGGGRGGPGHGPSPGPRGARRARRSLRRRPLRRADAHRRRATGARVQLPFRGSRDAIAPAAHQRRPARCACGAAAGDLSGVELEVSDDAAVTVTLAAGDYPAGNDVGSPIDGIEEAEQAGALVFHAGTALNGDRLVTNGGRILGVTSTGVNVAVARERAYAACELISFAGMRYRNDIAAMAHV